jgi:hypothetical protein
MQAIFFRCDAADAIGIRSSDDLPSEPASDELTIGSPAALFALATALDVPPRGAWHPVRDATCQSFPVWRVASELADALRDLPSENVDRVACAWEKATGPEALDADLFELATCVADLRQALEDGAGGPLFVLLEERAW